MSKDRTNLSFTDEELIELATSLAARVEHTGEMWDFAREHDPENADHWRVSYERAHRLHRRALTARRRLARKAGA